MNQTQLEKKRRKQRFYLKEGKIRTKIIYVISIYYLLIFV